VDKPSIWMVDDDASVRDALIVYLEIAGYDVRAFESGESLLERTQVSGPKPQVLLLDQRLGPGMSGLEVQSELRRRGIAIPIIFITGHGDARMARTALEQGAAYFLEKPFHYKELLASIERAAGSGKH
jgi:FixJ family two-component response regulator